MKVWIVVATLVWPAAVGLGPASVCLLIVEQHAPRPSYKKVTFTTENASEDSYKQFVAALQLNWKAEMHVRHTIPVMRESTTVPDSERFVFSGTLKLGTGIHHVGRRCHQFVCSELSGGKSSLLLQ